MEIFLIFEKMKKDLLLNDHNGFVVKKFTKIQFPKKKKFYF